MGATTTRLSIDDFELLPLEQVKDHELVDGELIDVSGNTLEHNSIQAFLFGEMRLCIRSRRLGTVLFEQEYDFGGNAHGPDISFFGPAKEPLRNPKKRIQRFVPDLAVEIVSESQSFNDLVRKKERYRRYGTAEVWIVVPESREVYLYSESGDRILRAEAELTTPLLPGFQIRVGQLFETF